MADGLGMGEQEELAQAEFAQQLDAHDLDPPRRRAGAAANKGQGHQDQGQIEGPVGEDRGRKAGAGQDGGHLEGAMTQGLPAIVVSPGQGQGGGDEEGRNQEDETKGPHLRIPDQGPERPALPDQEMDGEVGTPGEHEKDADAIDQGAVPIAEAGVMGGEAAGPDRRVGMADGVEQAHARGPKGQGAGGGQGEVDQPEGAGRFGDARRQLFVLGDPRGLRPIELHAADAQHGQNGDGQDDDTHAAQKIELLTVVLNGRRQLVDTTGDDRGARGGEAGDGLKDRVRQAPMQSDHEGQGTDHAQEHPEEGYHQEAIAHREFLVRMPVRQPEEGPRRQSQEKRDIKNSLLAIAIVVGNANRGQKVEAVEHQEDAE